jgi:hypothetical protein
METLYGETRFNSSHLHYQHPVDDAEYKSNGAAMKYLESLWYELNKPLDKTIALYNAGSSVTNRVPTYTSTLDGITTLPYWYTSVIMPEEGITDRACVLFSINLDTNRAT